jgi:hypothetical protein
MKYIIGSLIISFGILLVLAIMLMFLELQAPAIVMEYVGLVWLALAVVTYPLARRIVRA